MKLVAKMLGLQRALTWGEARAGLQSAWEDLESANALLADEGVGRIVAGDEAQYLEVQQVGLLLAEELGLRGGDAIGRGLEALEQTLFVGKMGEFPEWMSLADVPRQHRRPTASYIERV